MPKTTKRAATKRAEKIARAHSTELLPVEKDVTTERRGTSTQKAPARGVARYPWASIIILCAILVALFGGLYAFHLPPFGALPSAQKTRVATSATPTARATAASTARAAVATPVMAIATSTVDEASSPCNSASVLATITRTGVPSSSYLKGITHTYKSADQVIDTSKTYCAGINTNRGLIVVELDPGIAPKTVNNFVFLAERHFYDGLTFHRVLSKSSGGIGIAQGGDPSGDGTGGPGYQFADETVQGSYTAGTVAMANSGANTNGSQFFINTADNSSSLAKSYNLFGHVVRGLNVAQSLTLRDPGTNPQVTPDVMEYVIVTPAS